MTNNDLNWGDDKRFLAPVVRFFQTITQFKWKSESFPNITVGILPPILIVNIPLWWERARDLPPWQNAKAKVTRALHIRCSWLWVLVLVANWKYYMEPWLFWPLFVLGIAIGWRRDMNSGEYYLTFVSMKVEERSKLW